MVHRCFDALSVNLTELELVVVVCSNYFVLKNTLEGLEMD